MKKEFPKALRKTFKVMWDEKFGPSEIWDDSESVRKSFLTKEGGAGSTMVPTQESYEKWDCTALFQATIYAKCFANSTGQTLKDLYLRPLGLPPRSFHSSVVSPHGHPEETRALAIDQLRRLRNSLAHLADDEMDDATFDQNIQCTIKAFQALEINTEVIEKRGKSDFVTSQTSKLKFQRNMAIGVALLR